MKFSVTDTLPLLELRTGPREGHLLQLRVHRAGCFQTGHTRVEPRDLQDAQE